MLNYITFSGRQKNYRHSIPGPLSTYLRMCSLADLPHFGKLILNNLIIYYFVHIDPACNSVSHAFLDVFHKFLGSTSSLFSTAVISGSSSAPDLKDAVVLHASAGIFIFYSFV